MTLPVDNNRVLEVVARVRALQALTQTTGTITKRSQGMLLQSLSSEELVAAALLLQSTDGQNMKEGQTHANHK